MDKQAALGFESISISVPWGHIAGRWYGNRNIRPILALHGWQDNLGTWARLVPLLPRHISILCIDFPGHGRSSKYPVGTIYHIIDYVAVIGRIVKEYKWQKVSLMGHSMGGVVSFVYAALYPHMVDMLIQVDIVKPVDYAADILIEKFRFQTEKALIENERLEKFSLKEPPSYLYEEMVDLLHQGSNKSVAKECCKYLLSRSIEKSQLYPQRYFFSRDGRLKYCVEMSGDHGLALEMAKRIKNIAYMLIQSDLNSYVRPIDEQLLDVLKANSSYFLYHIVPNSKHHLHLNNAGAVADLINPFILKIRPSNSGTSTLADSRVVAGANQPEQRSKL